MGEYAGKPYTLVITDPRDEAGTVLTNLNATAHVEVWNEARTTKLVDSAVAWDGANFRFTWDTSAVAAGRYWSKLSVTKNGGLTFFEWVEIELYAAPDGAPSLEGEIVPWCNLSDLCSPCVEKLDTFDPEVVLDAMLIASECLYNFTRRRWPGPQRKTIRPVAVYASPDTARTNAMLSSMNTNAIRTGDGAWFRGVTPFCTCSNRQLVGCSWLSQITLRGEPIVSVDEVLIDGIVVDPDRYRVDDYKWLVYLPDPTGVDDRSGWPCCQHHLLPSTEPDTFEVTYTAGFRPGRGGARASAALACQLVLAWTPGGAASCKLPKKVQSMTRQQVAASIADPTQLFAKGITGLSEVDLWVQSVLFADRNRPMIAVVPERLGDRSRRRTS